MKRAFLIWAVLAFLFTVNAAAEVSIKAEVTKTDISAEETTTYKCAITADAQEKIPDPKLPGFEGFDVLSRIQSSNMSFSKGKVRVELNFSFILLPMKTGELNIEPAAISIKNKVYASEGFKINVSGEIKKKPLPQKMPFVSEEPQITL